MGIKEAILKLMEEENYIAQDLDSLLKIFGFTSKGDKKAFKEVIRDMEKEYAIVKGPTGKYDLLDPSQYIMGELQGHEKGFGFLIPDDKEIRDIFIPIDYMLDAFSGDRVMAEVTKERQDDRSAEGRILKVLERKNDTIVGTFQKSKNFGFVVPDNKKINYDVFIPKSEMKKAKEGQKVVAKIDVWPRAGKNPEGKILEVLGYPSDKGVDILSIVKDMRLPYIFPEEVKREIKSIPEEVKEDDLRDREDLRDLKTFTIDGIDAKDLDDAISIELNDAGNYLLGVHIADVSHYVTNKTAIDDEAYIRGNSVYLIDRVIPMLPRELSNGICSLNEGVDRLTLSVFMEIDRNGSVKYHKITEGVIRSQRRLVYDHVSDFLEGKGSHPSLIDLEEEIENLRDLADILREKRRKRGSIDFDIPETEIKLDDTGYPVHIGPRDRRVADKIIEECMLVCNETVAEDMYWSELPFLYRIHEEPDMDRIATFNKFIHNFGYKLKATQEVHPKELQKLTDEVKGKKEEALINTLMLRSLKKAIYTPEDDMHFGLAAQYYTHFTAPIRRYADLIVHRIVKDYVKGKLSARKQESLEERLPKIGDHVSKTERKAEEAERAVEDLKMAEYMLDKIGQEYEGIVSSLTNFGIFVQLENTIEGLIRYEFLRDDYYVFDEDKYIVYGERSGKEYRLGDRAKIRVVNADLNKRTIDFMFVKEEE